MLMERYHVVPSAEGWLIERESDSAHHANAYHSRRRAVLAAQKMNSGKIQFQKAKFRKFYE